MTCLFWEPRKTANCACNTINPRGPFNFFFFLTVFCRFRRLRRQHCPKVTNFASPLHDLFFLRGINTGNIINPERARWVASHNKGFASYCPRVLPAMWWNDLQSNISTDQYELKNFLTVSSTNGYNVAGHGKSFLLLPAILKLESYALCMHVILVVPIQ